MVEILKIIEKFPSSNLFLQGKIACANVLSDLYAMGAIDIDNMLMLLSTSNKMNEKERDTVMPLMLEGFRVRLNVHEMMKMKINQVEFFYRIVLQKLERWFKEVKQLLILG